MKKLLIILLLSTIGYGQSIDSVQVFHPINRKHLRTVYDPMQLKEQLNKLNERYKTDSFILFFYIDDKSILRTKVRKDSPIEEII